MTNFQILHSKGIKSNRRVTRSSSVSKSKPLTRLTRLTELGFSQSSRTRILDIIREMAQNK